MQKLINVLALASFAVSAAVVGGGTWLYLNKDVLIEEARGKIAAAATEAIAGALPGMLDAAMPELPGATGGVVPMGESEPKYTGGALRLP
tara:strand:+ start:291 stop:560 length:270 start_codon:yes stop_codon:yes gene_type:complete